MESLNEEKMVVLNLITHQPDNDRLYLYAKDPYEAKYQFLIYKHEKVGLKHCNDVKAFKYSNMACKVFLQILKNTI